MIKRILNWLTKDIEPFKFVIERDENKRLKAENALMERELLHIELITRDDLEVSEALLGYHAMGESLLIDLMSALREEDMELAQKVADRMKAQEVYINKWLSECSRFDGKEYDY